jgi:hypothetical protein
MKGRCEKFILQIRFRACVLSRSPIKKWKIAALCAPVSSIRIIPRLRKKMRIVASKLFSAKHDH